MAYLMTDMAAGSDALRTMQKNMAAIPYDQANAAAESQALQLKNQQTQLIIKATELRNLVNQAGLDLSRNKLASLSKLERDPEFIKADTGEQAAMASRVLMLKDPEGASKLLKASNDYAIKQALAAQRNHDNAADIIDNVRARVEVATPEQLPEIINAMPKELKDAFRQIAPDVFDQKDPKLQLAQIKALSMTAAKQNKAQEYASRKALAEFMEDLRRETARMVEEDRYKRRESDRAARADDAEARREESMAKTIDGTLSRREREYNKPIATALAVAEAAFLKAHNTSQFNIFSSAYEDYDDAWDKYNSLEKELINKQLETLDGYPESDAKNARYSILIRRRDALSNKPDPKSDKSFSAQLGGYKQQPEAHDPLAKPIIGKKATANPELGASGPIGNLPNSGRSAYKPTQDLKSKVEATGQQYDPDKYDYRVLPNGAVQRKLKGQ